LVLALNGLLYLTVKCRINKQPITVAFSYLTAEFARSQEWVVNESATDVARKDTGKEKQSLCYLIKKADIELMNII